MIFGVPGTMTSTVCICWNKRPNSSPRRKLPGTFYRNSKYNIHIVLQQTNSHHVNYSTIFERFWSFLLKVKLVPDTMLLKCLFQRAAQCHGSTTDFGSRLTVRKIMIRHGCRSFGWTHFSFTYCCHSTPYDSVSTSYFWIAKSVALTTKDVYIMTTKDVYINKSHTAKYEE